jgi:hypothetical protein
MATPDDPPGEDQDDEESADEEPDESDSEPAERRAGPSRESGGSARSGGLSVSDGSGVVLGLLFWGWIVVPYLKHGRGGVKAVLMAKFFNKSTDGSPLP